MKNLMDESIPTGNIHYVSQISKFVILIFFNILSHAANYIPFCYLHISTAFLKSHHEIFVYYDYVQLAIGGQGHVTQHLRGSSVLKILSIFILNV